MKSHLNERTDFEQLLCMIDPKLLIRVLEKGVELEKLELQANPGDNRCQEAIRYSRALLSFLYCRSLGLK